MTMLDDAPSGGTTADLPPACDLVRRAIRHPGGDIRQSRAHGRHEGGCFGNGAASSPGLQDLLMDGAQSAVHE